MRVKMLRSLRWNGVHYQAENVYEIETKEAELLIKLKDAEAAPDAPHTTSAGAFETRDPRQRH